MNIKKTNAARQLDTLGVPYELHTAKVDESDLSAVAMARQLGVPADQVFKTLVARGDKHGVLMACIPGAAELDLKKLALVSGNKHVSLVALKEVQPLTGYVRGGCSPLGTKKDYPIFLDESAWLWDAIFISAGMRGLQLRLAPDGLMSAVSATCADLCKNEPT